MKIYWKVKPKPDGYILRFGITSDGTMIELVYNEAFDGPIELLGNKNYEIIPIYKGENT